MRRRFAVKVFKEILGIFIFIVGLVGFILINFYNITIAWEYPSLTQREIILKFPEIFYFNVGTFFMIFIGWCLWNPVRN